MLILSLSTHIIMFSDLETTELMEIVFIILT